MFSISKLSAASQAFMSNLMSTNKSRSLISSLALARILSDSIPVPTSAVADIGDYFRLNCRPSLDVTLGTLNEVIVIDVETIRSYTLAFYRLRYLAVAPRSHVLAYNADTSLVDFFGISNSIDPVAIETISKNSAEISAMCLKYAGMLSELKG